MQEESMVVGKRIRIRHGEKRYFVEIGGLKGEITKVFNSRFYSSTEGCVVKGRVAVMKLDEPLVVKSTKIRGEPRVIKEIPVTNDMLIGLRRKKK